MSVVQKLLQGGDVVKSVDEAMDKRVTSDEERLEAQLELSRAQSDYRSLEVQLLADQNLAQIDLNKAEARSGNLFIAGWRPAIGWIGVVALCYQFIIYPLLLWLPVDEAPPQMEADVLYTIIMGMLGIAGMRSFDKLKNTDTKGVTLASK